MAVIVRYDRLVARRVWCVRECDVNKREVRGPITQSFKQKLRIPPMVVCVN